MPEAFRVRVRGQTKTHFKYATLTVQGDTVTFAGDKTAPGLVKAYWIAILGVFGLVMLALLILAIASYQLQGNAAANDTLGVIAVILLIVGVTGPVVTAIWFTLARNRNPESYSATVARSQVSAVRVGFDWDLGCGLMLLATPIIGLIVLFALGKRVVKMRAPFDPSANAAGGWSFTVDPASAGRLESLLR